MDNVALVVTAWLGLGACGFTAGAVGVGLARRRLTQAAVATMSLPVRSIAASRAVPSMSSVAHAPSKEELVTAS